MSTKKPILCVTLTESNTFTFFMQDNESLHKEDLTARAAILQWKMYIQKKSNAGFSRQSIECQTKLNILLDKSTQKDGARVQEKSVACSVQDFLPKSIGNNTIGGKNLRTEGSVLYNGDLELNISAKGIPCKILAVGLRSIEKALNYRQNYYTIKLFHRVPIKEHVKEDRSESAENPVGLMLQLLMKLKSDEKQSQRINCFTVSPASKWLILVGSGNLDFEEESTGRLFCWNIKSTSAPEFEWELPRAVTCVTICPEAPQYCAVSLLDGSIRAYEFQTIEPKLIFDTRYYPEKGCHSSVVWQMVWRNANVVNAKKKQSESMPFRDKLLKMNQNADTGLQIAYTLISISEDGTVRQWEFNSELGLIYSTVIFTLRISLLRSLEIVGGISNLLRISNGVHIELPSRTPGLCIQFQESDNNWFLVGTLSGDIMLCHIYSASAARLSFLGHSSAVTSVAWKKSEPYIFLSSSLDCTIKIWQTYKTKPICILNSPELEVESYLSASWCPWNEDIIMGVHRNGLHLWDITQSKHTPILAYYESGITCATFAEHAKIILFSCDDGFLRIVRVTGEATLSFVRMTTAIRKLVKLDPFR